MTKIYIIGALVALACAAINMDEDDAHQRVAFYFGVIGVILCMVLFTLSYGDAT